jgi:hypothetical protein
LVKHHVPQWCEARQKETADTAAGENWSSIIESIARKKWRTEMNIRSLQIEQTGDFWRKKTVPKIRLTGKWLERAGFKPGHRVTVHCEQPGTLTLRFLEQFRPPCDATDA